MDDERDEWVDDAASVRKHAAEVRAAVASAGYPAMVESIPALRDRSGAPPIPRTLRRRMERHARKHLRLRGEARAEWMRARRECWLEFWERGVSPSTIEKVFGEWMALRKYRDEPEMWAPLLHSSPAWFRLRDEMGEALWRAGYRPAFAR